MRIFLCLLAVLLLSLTACAGGETVTETVVYPPAPQLISPEPGAVLDNADRTSSAVWNFDWSDVEGATQYHLYIKYPSAINPAVDLDYITKSSFQFAFVGTINSHYGWTWKVRAKVGGVWSEWSETWTFDVEFVDIDESDIYFPVQKEVQTIYPDGLVKGTLVLDGDYLRITRPVGNGDLLVWPYGYSLRIEGNEIQIVDNDGQIVACVGDSIKLGGGQIPAQMVEEFIGKSLPYDCEGPYWIVSSERLNDSLVED